MARSWDISNNRMKTGNAWLIVSFLTIFFFLFQWLIIYSVTTIHQCDELSSFWLASGQDGLNPFLMVGIIFALIFVWSFFDCLRGHTLNYKDKIFSKVVFLGVFVCTLFVFIVLWAQWEYFQVESGLLPTKDSIFFNVDWVALPFDYEGEREMWELRCERWGTSYNR